jgi:hypothetical protein
MENLHLLDLLELGNTILASLPFFLNHTHNDYDLKGFMDLA